MFYNYKISKASKTNWNVNYFQTGINILNYTFLFLYGSNIGKYPWEQKKTKKGSKDNYVVHTVENPCTDSYLGIVILLPSYVCRTYMVGVCVG